MASIADTVMLDDSTGSAVGPFDAGHISFLKDDFVSTLAVIEAQPEVQHRLDRGHAQARIATIGSKLVGLPVNLQEWHRTRWVATAWDVIECTFDSGKRGDLLAQLAGQAVHHAAALRIAGDVNTMRIHTVIVFHVAYQVACELHIIGIPGWPKVSYTGIPRGRAIDSLRKDQDETRLI